jgi:protease-4
MMDATYDTFLAEVAEGRRMSNEDVRQLAKGRVWSGAQAVEVIRVWLAGVLRFERL